MVSMCCVFRSLPVVAGIWLIITFECTCYASIEVTTTFKPNKLDCNLTEAIDISDGKMGDDKSVVFNGTTFTEDYYIVNEEKRYMACPPGDPTAELTSPSESILPKTMIISVVFLLATILVYLCLPELLNLLGKCLLCYLASLTLTFALTAYIYLHIDPPDTRCYIISYVLFFAQHSTFIWTNVLSFDLWSSFRANMGFRDISDKKRFVLYLAYVWSWAFVITIVACILDNVDGVADDFRPGFTKQACYLTQIPAIMFRFVYLPLCIIFLINATLFTMSTMEILQVQRELRRSFSKEEGFHRQNSSMDKRNSYMLFLRLMIVFGLTWIFEGISFIAPDHWIFLCFDILNTLQGLIIFLLFVMKARVRKLIKKKWQNWSGAIQDHGNSTIIFTSDSSPTNVNNNYRLTHIAQSKCPS